MSCALASPAHADASTGNRAIPVGRPRTPRAGDARAGAHGAAGHARCRAGVPTLGGSRPRRRRRRGGHRGDARGAGPSARTRHGRRRRGSQGRRADALRRRAPRPRRPRVRHRRGPAGVHQAVCQGPAGLVGDDRVRAVWLDGTARMLVLHGQARGLRAGRRRAGPRPRPRGEPAPRSRRARPAGRRAARRRARQAPPPRAHRASPRPAPG
jgi:hypothetical protein